MKLNDVFEFIGVLTYDPDITVGGAGNDELVDNLCEDALVHLPPPKVGLPHQLTFIYFIFGMRSNLFELFGNSSASMK